MRKLGKTENIRKHIICDTPFNFIRDLPCVSLVSLTSPTDIALLSQAKPSPRFEFSSIYLLTGGLVAACKQGKHGRFRALAGSVVLMSPRSARP